MCGQSKVGKPSRAFLRCVTASAPERAAVKRALERDDEPAVAVRRGHHPIHQHRLDRVLDRLGAGVDDEVARRAGRRDPVQLRLEPQRQHGLVFGMRVALDDERQRIEHGADHGGIVLAVGVGGDQRAHVEEAVRLARLVAVDHRRDTARPTRRDRRRPAARRTGCSTRPRARDGTPERAARPGLRATARRRGAVRARGRGSPPARYRALSWATRSRNAAARSRPVAVSFHRPHIVTVKR